MEIPKKLTDQILKKTKSTPEQLLNWWINTDVVSEEFPCEANPYLGKYKFYLFDRYGKEGTDIQVDSAQGINIYDIRKYVHRHPGRKGYLTKQFEKMYGLK